MAENPTLFDHEPSQPANGSSPEERIAKSVIDKLLKVRRSLSGPEQEFGLPRINLLIDEFRSLVRASPTQREEMVLYSVERQGAVTLTEIAEDAKLHPKMVKELVQSLIDKNLLYLAKRYVPGMDRPRWIIKSVRLGTPEADVVVQRGHSPMESNDPYDE